MSQTITPVINFSVMETPDGIMTLKHEFAQESSGAFYLKPGINVNPKDLIELIKEGIGEDDGNGGFIHPNIFYQKGKTLGWMVPASKRVVKFNVKSHKFELTIPLPNLVFISNGSFLKVFAIKDSVVTPETALYHAPLFNFSLGGVMCFGSVKAPKKLTPENLGEWESVVFDSYNSHSSHGDLVKKIKGQNDVKYIEFFKSLKDKRTYPLSQLNATNQNISDVIKG